MSKLASINNRKQAKLELYLKRQQLRHLLSSKKAILFVGWKKTDGGKPHI